MINSVNNINFKALYEHPNGKLSDKQLALRTDIVGKLRRSYKNGVSYEDYYEDRNMAFKLSRYTEDSVTLSMFYNKKPSKNFFYKLFRKEKFIETKVGTYSSEHPFDPDDIRKSQEKGQRSHSLLKLFTILPIIFAGIWGVVQITGANKNLINDMHKEIPTAVDSLKNKVVPMMK